MNRAPSQVGIPAGEHAAAARPSKGNQQFRPLDPVVLEHIRDAVVILDAAHQITDCNAAAEELYEFTLEDVRGRLFGEVTRCHWPPANGFALPPTRVHEWGGHVRQFTKNGREML